jgi:hypothetical protein
MFYFKLGRRAGVYVTDVWRKCLQLMEGLEKPLTSKYKIMNEWKYVASCVLTSLPVWDLGNFKCLSFVVQTAHC